MYEKGQYIIYGIRGVCEVTDIISMERPGEAEKKLYYELHPYYQKDSRIVAPVDSTKTVIRPLLTEREAQALISQIPEIPEMELYNDKQREERYKEALRSCDCRVWVSMIKALYLRKKDRQEQGKKMTDLDERYFRSAEENLYSELSLALGIPRTEMVEYIAKRILE